MDPVTLAALISLVGAGTGAVASSNAAGTAAQGLGFQKEQAAQATRLGEAGHTDAYGDTQTYDPATNTWQTTLSPTQQAVTDAQQSEQLKSLNQDAARNRSIKETQFQAAQQAIPEYNAADAGYKYDQPASQKALADQINTLMTNANNNASSSNESMAARELLRQGRGGDLSNLIKTVQDNRGKALASDQLNSFTASQALEPQLQQQHQSKYLPAMQQAAGTIAAAGGAPVNTSSIVPALTQGSQQDAQQAIAALMGGNQAVGGAYGNLVTAQDKQVPNLTGIAALYKAMQPSGTAKNTGSYSSSTGEQGVGFSKGDGSDTSALDSYIYGF